MPQLTPFRVNPKAFHELIIMPQFADVLDDIGNVTQPSPEEGDWMIMDNVVYERPIIELFGSQNVLKRRDATCKLIYSPVGRLGNRKIRTEKLYAATEDCQEEFYQGCFIDYENENFQMFFQNVMPILEKGVATDIYTNKYFGDISRAGDVNGIWSWNKFDGIFKYIQDYVDAGVIPTAQTFTIAGGTLSTSDAATALATAYAKQDFVMKSMDPSDKAFYVDQELADAYWDYLITTGSANPAFLQNRQNSVPMMSYRGIEIRVKQWDGILAALNGGTSAHVCILTLKGNFLYATDSSYGGGPRNNEAVRIWYSEDDMVWRRQIHLKAGTEIAAPQYIILGMTEF